ncbi:SlyX family protein [Pasteurella atlantica]|uniref:SlyX family protein n=2 Tax=Pasteurellaceae TaxID=712 RepID=A0ACC6HK40_9PAST|nr:SlyX family protein [Pasteurella atlantica]MDP8051208.1 SlyX family protein [Pasteurella atlantica]MDP8100206.1 SlyX family protein [Pasteurella atlantica]MDP8104503.1 SlyX family protein [Pasteurella atlantica]MDP8147944.1 SlyX family protein [Pasteurella atlantica]
MNTTPHQLSTYIAELETKIAFQELAIEDLNQAIIQQQFILDKLQIQVRHLAEKLTNSQPSNIASLAEETPPPHY